MRQKRTANIAAVALGGLPQPRTAPVRERPTETGYKRAGMPDYYGFRKQVITAEKPNGERLQTTVKNCLNKGWKMITLPKV